MPTQNGGLWRLVQKQPSPIFSVPQRFPELLYTMFHIKKMECLFYALMGNFCRCTLYNFLDAMEGERCGSQLGRYCSAGLKCIGQTDQDNGYGKCHYTGNLQRNIFQLEGIIVELMLDFIYKLSVDKYNLPALRITNCHKLSTFLM